MKIAVCVKFSPDPEDIQARPDGSISLERAEWIIGGFDLQAIEAGTRLVEALGGALVAISAGPKLIDQSKLRKDVLSRGPDELVLLADDALTDADTAMTARALVAALRKHGPFDLVLCGEGSADLYFQQVGLQVGELLGWPTLNFISKIEPGDGRLRVERALDDELEVLDVPLPAVLSVTTDINTPRLPGMKQILSAGKKPVTVESLAEAGLAGMPASSAQVLAVTAPRQKQRKQVSLGGSPEESARALIDALKKEGVL